MATKPEHEKWHPWMIQPDVGQDLDASRQFFALLLAAVFVFTVALVCIASQI